MNTKAVRLHGENDLRLDTISLPELGTQELLVKIISDSLCMSSYKAAVQGSEHKRVPENISSAPVIIGHEFCGEILEVGAGCPGFAPGQRFVLQPAMSGTQDAAGYSFAYIGGGMQYGIVPSCYLQQNCVLPYTGDAWFYGSLAEPISCVIRGAHANYHTVKGSDLCAADIREGGNMALLAAAGPMGLAMIDYIIHRQRKPSLLLVTDIDQVRLDRAAQLLPVAEAARNGVKLVYFNTNMPDAVAGMLEQSAGAGYDDVFVFAPVASVVEQGDTILGPGGCLNFFSGPTEKTLSAKVNLYNIHYNDTHIMGSSGGNTDDMREAIAMSAAGKINPAILVTHIGGLNAVAEATLNLPKLSGGKKLIYNHISLPLTSISDFGVMGKDNPLFARLDEICAAHGGLWCAEGEKYLLDNAPNISSQ